MKFYKSILRIWFAFASLLGFLAGWAFLAQSPKPQPYSDLEKAQVVADLPPVPTIDQLLISQNPGTGNGAVLLRPVNMGRRFRTGGS